MADWCRAQPIPGMRVEIHKLRGHTPVLLVDIPGELPGSALLYGHLDKQPEFTGWQPGLGPWEPVLRDGKLYGRGAADDGYAVFSSLTAIAALKAQRVALPRCVLLIEASEESGSIDLPPHLAALGEDAIGDPSLVVCLDAECGNYEQVWCTTSLRGNLVGLLHVRVLEEGVHSGMATGIAPTPFRIVEQLLARLESPINGGLLLDELSVSIPQDRRAQIDAAARVLGESVAGKLPWASGAHAVSNDPVELLINSTWKATLAVTGADGMPPTISAGNVLLPAIQSEAVTASAADMRSDTRRARGEGCAGEQSAVWRSGALRVGRSHSRVERPRLRALARGVDHACLTPGLRTRGRSCGMRRHHPLHGHAG